MELKEVFNHWACDVQQQYREKQWLLSKWEIWDGIDWPNEKREIMIKSIVEGLNLRSSDYLIDLGCGGGWIFNSLKPFVKSIQGLDFSLEMLNCATSCYPDNMFVCGEVARLPYHDNLFTCALSYFVFINITNDQYIKTAISDIIRILQPGGRALIGQLPDKKLSHEYDKAKRDHLNYYQRVCSIGKNSNEKYHPPLKLFEKDRLRDFLNRNENIRYKFSKSFNPFYRVGLPELIDWRFDLIIEKR